MKKQWFLIKWENEHPRIASKMYDNIDEAKTRMHYSKSPASYTICKTVEDLLNLKKDVEK